LRLAGAFDLHPEAAMGISRVARICFVFLVCYQGQGQAQVQFNKQEVQTLIDLTERFLKARQDLIDLSETSVRAPGAINTYSCARELYHELVFASDHVSFSIDLLTINTKMVNDQDKKIINEVISRNAVFDFYNLEESRRNINRLVSSCSNSPVVANYARMSLSLVGEAERSFSSLNSRLPRP
jgi:hypothetical protein